MAEIAELIVMAIRDFDNKQDEIRSRAVVLCERFPLY